MFLSKELIVLEVLKIQADLTPEHLWAHKGMHYHLKTRAQNHGVGEETCKIEAGVFVPAWPPKRGQWHGRPWCRRVTSGSDHSAVPLY